MINIPEPDLNLTDQDFAQLTSIIFKYSGIVISTQRRYLLTTRLSRRIRDVGCKSFSDYCNMLNRMDGKQEIYQMINLVTTNHTSFFREAHHFDHLAEQWKSFQESKKARPLRIWSAGCSSGQEPYSMAIKLLSASAAEESQFEITATDLDSDILDKAKTGVYKMDDVRSIPADLLTRYFHQGEKRLDGPTYVVNDNVRNYIKFSQLNLHHAAWPFSHKFDVIFCRNVTIYFSKELQKELFAKFAQAIEPGGFLCIGHAETLMGLSEDFELLGQTIYQRKV